MKVWIIIRAMLVTGIVLIPVASYAQSAGDPCSTAGQIAEVTSSGASSDLICDGGNYVEYRSIATDGRVSYNFDNDTDTCNNDTAGRLRYDESSDTWEACDRMEWRRFGQQPERDVVCWGRDNFNQISGMPAGQKGIAISARRENVCVLEADGDVVCWGSDSDGQVTNVPSNPNARAIHVSHNFAHLIDVNNDMVGWGANANDRSTPPADKAISIGGAAFSTYALTEDGTMVDWGWGDRSFVPGGLSNVIKITGGYLFACALKEDHTLTCWGHVAAGGDDNGQITNAPTTTKFMDYALAGQSGCAIEMDGSTFNCWGDTSHGQTTDYPTGKQIVKIVGESNWYCAIASDKTLNCWGIDEYNQLTDIPTGYDFYDVGIGYHFGCALVEPQ